MADLLTDFLPVFTETADSVRTRLDSDANAGLEQDDPQWMDTREGSFYWDITQTLLLEFVRLWDALSLEVPAAAFPQYAWGDYLDDHAAIFGLLRKEAVAATGTVRFTGTPGTVVAQDTRVGAASPTLDGSEVEYATVAADTIGPITAPPTGLVATPDTASGSVPANTYHYTVTAVTLMGETLGSAEVEAVLTAQGNVALDWDDVTDAVSYRIYRGAGDDVRQLVGASATSDFTDMGTEVPGVAVPDADTTAGVRIDVQAVEPGSDSNVGAGAVTLLLSANPGITAVLNEGSVTGGTDPETDDALRERILAEFEGQGAGNQNDYRRWALGYPGVGRVSVVPVWDGPGTVQVVVMDADGHAVPSAVVDGLQAYLDPDPGLGRGQAPIGAAVTVATPAVVGITVAASITHAPGYSLDGTGGTIATRPLIEDALRAYIEGLQVGDYVIYEHVKAALFVKGVYTVAGVQVNSGTSDIAITTDPPQIAQFTAAALA